MAAGKVDESAQGSPLVPVVRCEAWARVRVERGLPATAEVLVREGEPVRATQVIARAPNGRSHRVHIVDVAGTLDLPGREVSSAMVKQRGERVHVGELLAARRSVLPFAYRACRSPVDGQLRMVWYGWAVIEMDADEGDVLEITAQVDGSVVAVVPGSYVTIETEAAWIEGVCGTAGEAYGMLQVVRQPSATPWMPEELPEDVAGAIWVVDGSVSRPALEQAAAMGVKGLIAAGISVTASEVATLPVMATEGYGVQRMAPERLRLFQELEGCYATLIVPSEHTPPWSRRRPVVIVPRASPSHPEDDPQSALRLRRPLCPGDRVRVVRAPRAGQWGVVAAEMGDRQIATPSGAIAAGVEVRFSAHDVAWLPYLNLERIVCTA
ncbi:MAG: hypothetical protein DDG58_08890 [Ardenticatenia bacterium]|jgi:hypothetical protein|nr:MAG: hypothetical protein DDG58_08890 [Ardenticatenia bacterium]